MIKSKLSGIRFKLIIIFWTSLVISILFGLIINSIVVQIQQVDYDVEFNYKYKEFNKIVEEIIDAKSDAELDYIIEDNKDRVNIFVLDDSGKVIKKNSDRSEQSFDLNSLKNKDKYTRQTEYRIEFNYLVKINSNQYIYLNTILNKGDKISIIIICTAIVFILLFLSFTHKELSYIKYLSKGLNEISNGNLEYRVDIKGKDEISEIAKSINIMTERLENNKKEEKRIEKNKDEFIMNISHDLRTPLTSIIGYVKLVKGKYKNNDEIKEYINIIDLKSQQLDKLINNFFEYNTLTIGQVKIEKVSISLNEFLRQIVTGMLPLCIDKNLKIKLLLPSEELIYSLDPEKMLRAIENLISNAIKYSDKNTDIIVSLKDSIEYYSIIVENICSKFSSTDNMKKLFERFYRADKSRNSSTGGAGLGLAIAKSIIELHSGKILIEHRNNIISFNIILNK